MRYIWFICICLTILLGSFSYNFISNIEDYRLAGSYEYKHSIWTRITTYLASNYCYYPGWKEKHLNKIQYHFQVIFDQLKAYYEKNKQYPDNNEGLTVLTELRARLIKEQAYLPPPIGSCQEDCNGKYGVADEGMVSFDGGILSPWLEPFVYENRRGLEKNIFADSPVNRDKKQYYSIKVDDEIYVYSVGAMMYYHDYARVMAKRNMTHIIVWSIPVLSFVLLILFIWLFIKAKRPTDKLPKWWLKPLKVTVGILMLLLSVIIGLKKHEVYEISCYMILSNNFLHRPKMISQYNVLLDKYRQRGVITDATYQKIKQSLGEVDKLIQDGKIR